MPRQVFLFDPPERFVVGTIGEPGERAFFLQARSSARVISVAWRSSRCPFWPNDSMSCSTKWCGAAAGSAPVPAVSPSELADGEPLDQPVLEEFRVGTLALAWDAEAEIVIVEALAADRAAEDDDEAASVWRLRSTTTSSPMARTCSGSG